MKAYLAACVFFSPQCVEIVCGGWPVASVGGAVHHPMGGACSLHVTVRCVYLDLQAKYNGDNLIFQEINIPATRLNLLSIGCNGTVCLETLLMLESLQFGSTFSVSFRQSLRYFSTA